MVLQERCTLPKHDDFPTSAAIDPTSCKVGSDGSKLPAVHRMPVEIPEFEDLPDFIQNTTEFGL
jgi:hypothetical protein